MERAKEILAETHDGTDADKKRLAKEIQNLEKQRQVLEKKLLEGTVSDETYTRQHARIEEELTANEVRVKDITSKRQDHTKLFEGLIRLANNVPAAYKQAPAEVKMMYLSIFWEHFEMRDKTITKAVPSKGVISMVNEGLITLKKGEFSTEVLTNRVWLPILDDMRTKWYTDVLSMGRNFDSMKGLFFLPSTPL